MTQVTQQQQATGTYNSLSEKRVDFTYNMASQFETIKRYKDADGGEGNHVATSQYTYDYAGRLDSLSHDLGSTGTPEIDYDLAYDLANRLTSLTNTDQPDEEIEQYDYDGRGELIEVDYDESGPDDEDEEADNTITYAYDDSGLMTGAADDDLASYTNAYDYQGRMTGVTYNGPFDLPEIVLTYGHDYSPRITSVLETIDSVDAGLTEYMFNTSGLMTAIAQHDDSGDPADRFVAFDYFADHRLKELSRYLGPDEFGDWVTTSTYSYDAAARLSGLLHDLNSTANPNPDIEYGFGYDAVSRLESFTNSATRLRTPRTAMTTEVS